MSLLVKICGLASERDVRETIEAGPDALGFNFWYKSPRVVTAEQVASWTRGVVPAGMRKVGIFVDASAEEIHEIVKRAGLDVVQLHGEESVDVIRQLDCPVWKVMHLDRLPAQWRELPVERVLIDSGTVAMPGGTGLRVDTERARTFVRESKLPVVLAGGLKSSTVGEAIREVRPD
jgi:phosphoribosylanthranilate isomerase